MDDLDIRDKGNAAVAEAEEAKEESSLLMQRKARVRSTCFVSTTTLSHGIHCGASTQSHCFLFFQKFRLPIGLHSSSSINPTADARSEVL